MVSDTPEIDENTYVVNNEGITEDYQSVFIGYTYIVRLSAFEDFRREADDKKQMNFHLMSDEQFNDLERKVHL